MNGAYTTQRLIVGETVRRLSREVESLKFLHSSMSATDNTDDMPEVGRALLLIEQARQQLERIVKRNANTEQRDAA